MAAKIPNPIVREWARRVLAGDRMAQIGRETGRSRFTVRGVLNRWKRENPDVWRRMQKDQSYRNEQDVLAWLHMHKTEKLSYRQIEIREGLVPGSILHRYHKMRKERPDLELPPPVQHRIPTQPIPKEKAVQAHQTYWETGSWEEAARITGIANARRARELVTRRKKQFPEWFPEPEEAMGLPARILGRALTIKTWIQDGMRWAEIAERSGKSVVSCRNFYYRVRRIQPGRFPLPDRQDAQREDEAFEWAKARAAGESLRAIARRQGTWASLVARRIRTAARKNPGRFRQLSRPGQMQGIQQRREQVQRNALRRKVKQAESLEKRMTKRAAAKIMGVQPGTVRTWKKRLAQAEKTEKST